MQKLSNFNQNYNMGKLNWWLKPLSKQKHFQCGSALFLPSRLLVPNCMPRIIPHTRTPFFPADSLSSFKAQPTPSLSHEACPERQWFLPRVHSIATYMSRALCHSAKDQVQPFTLKQKLPEDKSLKSSLPSLKCLTQYLTYQVVGTH